MKINLNISLILLFSLLLISCGTGDFLGFEKKKVRLEGERFPAIGYFKDEKDKAKTSKPVELSALEIRSDWPQTQNSPTHLSPNFASESKISRVKYVMSGKGENQDSKILSQPIIQNNIVFLLDANGNVISFDLIKKKTNWKVNIVPTGENSHNIGGGIAKNKKNIFVNSPYGEVLALDSDTGELLWKKSTSSPLRSPPTIIDNKVLSLTLDNKIFAFNTKNGDIIWEHSGIYSRTTIMSSPKIAAEGNILIAPYSNGDFLGLNLANGREIWGDNVIDLEKSETSNVFADIDASPVIRGNIVIVASNFGKIIAVEKKSGTRLWVKDYTTSQTPLVNGNSIFIINRNQEIVCLDIMSGELRWITNINKSYSEKFYNLWFSPILVNNKLLIVGGDRKILIVDPFTGSIENDSTLPAFPVAAPFVVNKEIFVLLRNANIINIQ